MPRVPMIEPENMSEEARKALQAHLAEGYRLTNEKKTLLHDPVAFDVLEVQSYRLDRELQRLVGKRAADLFEYAISAQNECLVCSVYFIKLLRSHGIEDVGSCALTEEEKLLMEYGRAMARDPAHVPDALYDRLKERYDAQTIVVLTAMGVMMIANNVFNDVMQVEAETL